MKSYFLFLVILLLSIADCSSGQSLLESGKPIKASPDFGPARFALPSINGFVMGMARISGNKHPDLLMYSDKYNPGTFYYPFKGLDPAGTPIFGQAQKLVTPFEKDVQNRAVVVETSAGDIFGFWAFEKKLVVSKFDKTAKRFGQIRDIQVRNLPNNIIHFGLVGLASGKYLFTCTVVDTVVNRRYPVPSKEPAHRHDFESYGREGFWQTQLPKTGVFGAFVDDLELNELTVSSLTDLQQTNFFLEGYCSYRAGAQEYVLAGTTLGNTHAYSVNSDKKTLSFAGYLHDKNKQTLRNPAVHQYLTYLETNGTSGLISVGEGGIWFYKKRAGKPTASDLEFDDPVHVLQTDADLYGASLAVPELVDWDQDGDLDIVSGNSLGHIQFFENKGSNTLPVFKQPQDLKAGGYDIHIQPGYNQDIQGPYEARWGYPCPAVYDWTGDGLPDILTGDARGKFNIYVNSGKQGKPKLEPEHPLYLDGLDMHGTWRVRPGVGRLGEKNAYIVLDEDDEFHLYRQLDHFNLTDGGKLMIGDSMPIRANFRGGGETGRSKIHIVDWDQDGVKDLLVGTPRYSTIPEPKKGMPYRLKNNGAAVLFLRNSGSEEKPVFEYPVPLRFKGKRINLGQHSCAPTTGVFGPGNSLNLLVGDETGRFYFYERKDLSWSAYQEP